MRVIILTFVLKVVFSCSFYFFESCFFNNRYMDVRLRPSLQGLNQAEIQTLLMVSTSGVILRSGLQLQLSLYFPESRAQPVCFLSCFHLLLLQRWVFLPKRPLQQFQRLFSVFLFLKETLLYFENFKEFFTANSNEKNTGGKMTSQRKLTKFQISSNGGGGSHSGSISM